MNKQPQLMLLSLLFAATQVVASALEKMGPHDFITTSAPDFKKKIKKLPKATGTPTKTVSPQAVYASLYYLADTSLALKHKAGATWLKGLNVTKGGKKKGDSAAMDAVKELVNKEVLEWLYAAKDEAGKNRVNKYLDLVAAQILVTNNFNFKSYNYQPLTAPTESDVLALIDSKDLDTSKVNETLLQCTLFGKGLAKKIKEKIEQLKKPEVKKEEVKKPEVKKVVEKKGVGKQKKKKPTHKELKSALEKLEKVAPGGPTLKPGELEEKVMEAKAKISPELFIKGKKEESGKKIETETSIESKLPTETKTTIESKTPGGPKPLETSKSPESPKPSETPKAPGSEEKKIELPSPESLANDLRQLAGGLQKLASLASKVEKVK